MVGGPPGSGLGASYGIATDVHGQLSLGLLASIVISFVVVAYVFRSQML